MMFGLLERLGSLLRSVLTSARKLGRLAAASSLLAAAMPAHAIAASTGRDLGWQLYVADGYPLKFEYPGALFVVMENAPAGGQEARSVARSGQVFSTSDGRAVLQVGAFQNIDRLAAPELRSRALKSSYTGAEIDYDRLASNWFVLSGRRGDEMFYERVTLSCGGSRIDVWTLSYPIAERGLFDRVVEEMARRHRPVLQAVRCL